MTVTIATRLRPVADRIVLKRDEQPETTPGGIVLPESADWRDSYTTATVVAVGPAVAKEPGDTLIEAGCQVICGKFSGVPIEVEGEKLVIVREDDVLLVLE